MFRHKAKRFVPFVVFIPPIILFLFVIILKVKILDFFRLPLVVTSGLISDTKSVFVYQFIVNENLRLKKELGSLKKDAIIISGLRLENERLRKLLSFKERSQFDTVAASVISRDPNNWSGGVVIDKGRRHKIRLGNVVINDFGLVGKVIEVSGDTSKIMLINDPNSSVAAVVQRSKEEGLISGTLLGGLVMRYLNKDSDIVVSDVVLTSGLTVNYPPAIIIGEVKSIEEEQGGLNKYCLVVPVVDLAKLEEVLVVVGDR